MKKIERIETTDPRTGEIVSRVRVSTLNTDPTRTQQQFGPETDVNNIMKKYLKTGIPPVFKNTGRGVYADTTKVTDYQAALDTVISAERAFGTLPSHIRSRFHNEPAKLIEFLADSKNLDEAIRLGILERKTPPKSGAPNNDPTINHSPQTPPNPAPPKAE